MKASSSWIKPAFFKKVFNNTIDYIFAIILLFITLTMIIGVVRLFYRLSELIQSGGITGNYLYIFADVLTLFILIELSRSLFEYFSSHKLPLVPIIDAGIVFVIRHIMIDLFNHKMDTDGIYALSTLLFPLGAIRIGISVTTHFEKELAHSRDDSAETQG